MKKFQASNSEIIFYSYFIGFFYLLFALLVDGDFFKGYSFCYQVSSFNAFKHRLTTIVIIADRSNLTESCDLFLRFPILVVRIFGRSNRLDASQKLRCVVSGYHYQLSQGRVDYFIVHIF